MFQIEDGIDINILALIPSVLLGVVGGLLGSAFILLNLRIVRLRKKVQDRVQNIRLGNKKS